jgi:large subunit ribosomal protein L6
VSRIGKLPITVPGGVKISQDSGLVRVEGPKGQLSSRVPEKIGVKIEDGQIKVERQSEDRRVRALHGLTRKLIANMVVGVSQGFARVLEINGVGYRAEAKESVLNLTLGYSHPITFPLPPGVSATVERQTVITLRGADNQVLGEAASRIRALRPPEPYKGKGIKYQEEVIQRKAGKAVGGAGAK